MVDSQPGTVPQAGPSAPRYIMPNQMQVERVGNMSSGVTAYFPEVRGGICEYCGVVDGNVDPKETGIQQYQLCQHYRGLVLRCSYCPENSDALEVAQHSVLRVLQHPDKPNKLLVHCNSVDCLKSHERRWKVANG